GNIERVAKAVLHTAQDLAFVFKRMRRFDPQFQGEISNRHDLRLLYETRPHADRCCQTSAPIAGSIPGITGFVPISATQSSLCRIPVFLWYSQRFSLSCKNA